jgi:hypothetical protein
MYLLTGLELLPETKNEFNPGHLEFEHLTLAANDFYYEKDHIKISVKNSAPLIRMDL